ncbi:hypothetical protein HYR54_00175 [Candidatus Acetothermia bacterium]|nr:hypothetical protein [Candidatus Acetothermia bacterium]
MQTLTTPKAVNQVAFSPDGNLLAYGFTEEEKGTITLWDVTTRHEVRTIPYYGSNSFSFQGNHDLGNRFGFSPDGHTLAASYCLEETSYSYCSKPVIRFWDATTGESLYTLRSCCLVAFSPNGQLLASESGFLWYVGHLMKK